MATALPVETSRPDGLTENLNEPSLCECDRGVQYEHRCCGALSEGRCCMDPEWVMRECDQCGGVGIR
jgi:hypothetical protein